MWLPNLRKFQLSQSLSKPWVVRTVCVRGHLLCTVTVHSTKRDRQPALRWLMNWHVLKNVPNLCQLAKITLPSLLNYHSSKSHEFQSFSKIVKKCSQPYSSGIHVLYFHLLEICINNTSPLLILHILDLSSSMIMVSVFRQYTIFTSDTSCASIKICFNFKFHFRNENTSGKVL